MSGIDTALGIDVGSYKIVVAECKNDKAGIVLASNGERATPFCVGFNHKRRLFGQAAEDQAIVKPENSIFGKDVHRMIGRTISEVDPEKSLVQVQKLEPKDDVAFSVSYKNAATHIYPEQALAMTLKHALEHIKPRFGEESIPAVVTVPAMFNSTQRYAIKNACTAAGLDVLQLLNNATASAITYSLERNKGGEKNIFIFDMGSTSLDIGIFKTQKHKVYTQWAEGDLNLGGEDFIDVLVDHFLDEFYNSNWINMRTDKIAVSRVRSACEAIMKTLSTTSEATQTIEKFYDGKPYQMNLTKHDFEMKCAVLFQKIRNIVVDALHHSGLNANEIGEVILVGGCGRIPKIEEILKDIFHGKKLSKALSQDESRAFGAAYLASDKLLAKTEKHPRLEVQDIACIPLIIPVGTSADLVLVEKGTVLPFKNETLFRLKDSHKFRFYQNGNFLSEKRYDCNAIKFFPSIDASGLIEISAVIYSMRQNITETVLNFTKLDDHKIDVIMKQAEIFKHDEEELKHCEELQHDIQLQCEKYKKIVVSEELKESLDEPSKNRVIKKCDDLLLWIQDDASLNIEKLKEKLQKLHDQCIPIIEKGAKIKKVMEKAYLEDQQEHYDEACKSYTELIELLHQNDIQDFEMLKTPYLRRCKTLFKLKRYQGTISDCDYLVRMNFVEPQIYKIRGQCYFYLNKFNECVKDLKIVLAGENDPELRKLYEKAEHTLVEQHVNEQLETCLSLCKKGKHQEALKITNELLPLYKDKKMYEKLVKLIHYHRGRIYYELKVYSEAIEEFKIAITNIDIQIKVFKLRGLCYLELEQYEKAAEDFEVFTNRGGIPSNFIKQKIEHAKRMVQIEYNKSLLIECDDLLEAKQYQEALNVLEKIKYDELDREIKLQYIFKKIHAYYELQRYDEVTETCNAALKVDDQYSFAYFMKGIAHLHRQKYEKALKNFDAAERCNTKLDLSDYRRMVREHVSFNDSGLTFLMHLNAFIRKPHNRNSGFGTPHYLQHTESSKKKVRHSSSGHQIFQAE